MEYISVAQARELGTQLRRPQAWGLTLLAGGRISACDIYRTCFSLMIRPLAHELAPMPEIVHATPDPQIDDALDDLPIEHRDSIFRPHLNLPLDF